MIFTEAVLAPLQITARIVKQPGLDRYLAAVDMWSWQAVIDILQLSKSSRTDGLKTLRAHGYLKHVDLETVPSGTDVSVRPPSFDFLRRFHCVYTNPGPYIESDGTNTITTKIFKLFFNIVPPPQTMRPFQVHTRSRFDPREYSDRTKQMIRKHPTAKATARLKAEEDRELVLTVYTFWYWQTRYWAFQEAVPQSMSSSWATADEVRAMVVWKQSDETKTVLDSGDRL
jgi:hypothetical protein